MSSVVFREDGVFLGLLEIVDTSKSEVLHLPVLSSMLDFDPIGASDPVGRAAREVVEFHRMEGRFPSGDSYCYWVASEDEDRLSGIRHFRRIT